jgi:hypothetical protein
MFTEDSFGGVRIETLVTIPKEPSLPTSMIAKIHELDHPVKIGW